jgi:hypothetical protein
MSHATNLAALEPDRHLRDEVTGHADVLRVPAAGLEARAQISFRSDSSRSSSVALV